MLSKMDARQINHRNQFHAMQTLQRRRWRTIIQNIPTFVLVIFWLLVVLIPINVLISAAIKSPQDQLLNPLGWPHEFVWSNFTDAWNNANLGLAFGNSFIVTSIAILGLVIFGSSAAYPLARRTGKWSTRIYIYFIAGIIVPGQLSIIPLYREMRSLQLVNSLSGIILIFIAGSLPFVIFLYTGFIKTVPHELEEAAAIDGAGSLRTFWTIVFPLLKPVTATVVITTSLSIWNDFFTSLLFLQGNDLRTVPLAIYSFVGTYNNQWPLIFAAIIMSSLPLVLVFLFLQRYFIKGIAGGALKG